MDDLRSRLDQTASRFDPRPDAFEHVRARASARRARRRLTSGVVAVAVAVAALGGLWSVTHEVGQPTQSVTPTPSPTQAAHDLRIAMNAKVNGWIPLDNGLHVWVAGPGTLSIVDRATGDARIVARGDWDYDYTQLADYGEGTIFLAEGSSLWEIAGDGTVIAKLNLGLGSISAILQTDRRTWVAAIGPDGGVLAEIDLADGHAVRTFPIGQGVYQLAGMPGYVFVATREPRGPAVLRLDLSTGTLDPVPGADGVAIAVSGSTMWWSSPSGIHCVDARLLRPCGDVSIRSPVALAGDGGSLWVLSATGSTSALYAPDPNEPAQLTELDGTTGEILAGPINLPDFTPARLSVFDGRAWVGFHDTGRLVLVERCALDGCRPGTRASLESRLADVKTALRAAKSLVWNLRYRAERLRARPASLARSMNLETLRSELQLRTAEMFRLRSLIERLEARIAGL